MASSTKQVQQLAKQLFKLSVVDGVVSPDRVAGVLAYVEKHRPAHVVAVLKAYARLISAEQARGEAVVEHAGPVTPAVLAQIEATMSRKYGRPVTTTVRPNPNLFAGLKVRVGDDLYESSVASQLSTLASAV